MIIRYDMGEKYYLGCHMAEIIPIEPDLVKTSEGRFGDINLMKFKLHDGFHCGVFIFPNIKE